MVGQVVMGKYKIIEHRNSDGTIGAISSYDECGKLVGTSGSCNGDYREDFDPFIWALGLDNKTLGPGVQEDKKKKLKRIK